MSPPLGAFDFGVERVAAFAELFDSCLRIGLGAFAHLPQQLEESEEAGLGSHEAAHGERGDPANRLLGGGSKVELGLVGARPVELPEPPLLRARPVVEIGEGVPRKCAGAGVLPEGEQLVLERLDEAAL